MRAPWRLKMAAKLMLSRLPIRYETWRRISIFRHGAMDDADYAISVFDRHFAHAGPAGRPGFVAFELGPGDSVASALIARAYGASETYLVDVGPFAKRDIGPYLALADKLRDRGLDPIPVRFDDTIEDLLARCGGRYLTDGISSMRGIPPASVDFAWSHAVLEHVERERFTETMSELHRILRPHGRSSHRVDLEDHLAGSLNHLRFTSARWETPAIRRSGFYTNRLTCREIVDACIRTGFDADVEAERWDRLPVHRNDLAEPFRRLSEDEVLIRAMNLLLTRAR